MRYLLKCRSPCDWLSSKCKSVGRKVRIAPSRLTRDLPFLFGACIWWACLSGLWELRNPSRGSVPLLRARPWLRGILLACAGWHPWLLTSRGEPGEFQFPPMFANSLCLQGERRPAVTVHKRGVESGRFWREMRNSYSPLFYYNCQSAREAGWAERRSRFQPGRVQSFLLSPSGRARSHLVCINVLILMSQDLALTSGKVPRPGVLPRPWETLVRHDIRVRARPGWLRGCNRSVTYRSGRGRSGLGGLLCTGSSGCAWIPRLGGTARGGGGTALTAQGLSSRF